MDARISTLGMGEAVEVPELDRSDLPLERMYLAERNRAQQLFLTQPVDGKTINWTWGEAMREVRIMAAWLRAQEWPERSRIVLVAKNSAWWIMADFAIWLAGHISVPLFPGARDSSLVSLFQHCQPVACFIGQLDHPLLFDTEGLRGLSYIALPNVQPVHLPAGCTQWNDIVRSGTPMEDSPHRQPGEIATIIYTSGTTGHPKGVMQTFRALSLMAISMTPALGGRRPEVDRMLSYLPLAHIAERAIVEMNALFEPMHIFFTEGQPTFLTDLQRCKPTAFFSIPRLYIRFQQGVFEKLPEKTLNRLLSLPVVRGIVARKILRGLGLESSRILASGSAPIPTAVIQWYKRLGAHFVEGYGMTETGITHVPLPGRDRIGYVGHASSYAHTRISPEGEIQIAGPMNMAGYFCDEELTRQAFTGDGYFRTGDRGEIDEDGRLRIAGRLKEEFKTSKGKYVLPAQIEMLLAHCASFESVGVFGAGMTGPFAMAVLTPDKRKEWESASARKVAETQLLAELQIVNQQLEHHEQLRFLVICRQPWTVDNGMLTPTFKVRRQVLEERFSAFFLQWDDSQKKVIWMDTI